MVWDDLDSVVFNALGVEKVINFINSRTYIKHLNYLLSGKMSQLKLGVDRFVYLYVCTSTAYVNGGGFYREYRKSLAQRSPLYALLNFPTRHLCCRPLNSVCGRVGHLPGLQAFLFLLLLLWLVLFLTHVFFHPWFQAFMMRDLFHLKLALQQLGSVRLG